MTAAAQSARNARKAGPTGRAGTPHRARPRRRSPRTVLIPLLTAILALGWLLPVPASGAEAARPEARHPAADNDTPAVLTVTGIEPADPDEGDTLTVQGTVTNEGDHPILDAAVDPRFAVPLSSRSALDEALGREDFALERDGGFVQGHPAELETIPPGLSRSFTLQVPVSALQFGEPGVYQLAFTVTGQTEDQRWGDRILGVGRTVIPWQPGGRDGEPGLHLTALWPLVSTSHLTGQTQTDETQTPLFQDDALLAEISPGGRLYELVTLGAELPVTWVVDPDLLASVSAMAEEYWVAGPDADPQEQVAGRGQDVARAWLLRLKEAVRDAEVVALPFADPDLASLAHQGKEVPGVLSHLKSATDLAASTVETVLNVEPVTDYAWPVEGAVDPDIVSVATAAGADTVIARSDSLNSYRGLNYTPGAAGPIGGGTTAVVADARLSRLFEADMSRAGNISLAHQRLLAETLMIADEAPAMDRSLVLAPQRMPSAAQAQAMADALAALAEQGSWVDFAPLEETASAAPDADASFTVPKAAQYPERLREQELPAEAFHDMRDTQQTLDRFTVILTRPDRVVVPFGNAIRREMSVSWRGRTTEAARFRAGVENQLQELTEQVFLIEKSPVTLSGRSAVIPVTVQNNLVQDVQNLRLELTSSRRIGLEVVGRQEVTVGAGLNQVVKFEANARANGKAYLEAQLYTADGTPYGQAIRFQADVTSITSTVLLVISGGLLLVVLAGIRMYTQRKRAQATAPEDDGSSGDGADEADNPDDPDDPDDASAAGPPPGTAADERSTARGEQRRTPPSGHLTDTDGDSDLTPARGEKVERSE
ncbi:DUF6049 family protein [Streptomyces aidingensis]|uniref:DUF6049 family protein n=1 Tax=Streptomyces aidingensis TaxID=910347 RepID=UPI000B8420C9|nr:DUF6049 family protein [Streptomyces aidingensis]